MLEAVIVKQLRDYTLDLKLIVKAGEITALMGVNGSGKSTTLNIIAGLVKPDTASISLNNEVLFRTKDNIDIPTEDRQIGYVLQNSAVFPHMTVRDNVAFGLRARHLPRMDISERVEYWTEHMHIEDLVGVKAGNLSGGQKQRVALARAFAVEPDLLMLDEPFTGLDADSMKVVKVLVREFVKKMQIPCITVTHRAVDSADIGDFACVLCQGKKEWEGSPAKIPELYSVCHCT
ncbi:MAG: ATP-binding cassette domain-containing protein [Methanoregula sp.]